MKTIQFEDRPTLPIQKVVCFLERKFSSKIYQNGSEFLTIGKSPRLVALLKGQELILPSTNGTGVVKILVHKIPEYRKKFFNLFYCQRCDSYCLSHFLTERCPKGHLLRMVTSTFTWVEVRQRQPSKPQTADPEVEFARKDMEEAKQLRKYRFIFRRQVREEARRSLIREELQTTQIPKQESQSHQEQQSFQHFLNFEITYIKGKEKYCLTPEQRGRFWEKILGEPVSIPTAPLQVADEVVNERESPFFPISADDKYETLLPLKVESKPKWRIPKPDTGRLKVHPWRVERKTKTIRQQSPQPLSPGALRPQQQELQQGQHDQQISKEGFQKKYQLEDVAELPGGAVKGYRYISYNGSLVRLTFYSFLFRPSGRGIGEFNPEQVALAIHLANKMGGQVITSDDKKRNIVSLCVLLQDATVVIARRSAGQ